MLIRIRRNGEREGTGGDAAIDQMNLHNPVFATCLAAASIMILKSLAMPWLTVWRMMRIKGGP